VIWLRGAGHLHDITRRGPSAIPGHNESGSIGGHNEGIDRMDPAPEVHCLPMKGLVVCVQSVARSGRIRVPHPSRESHAKSSHQKKQEGTDQNPAAHPEWHGQDAARVDVSRYALDRTQVPDPVHPVEVTSTTRWS